MNILVLGAGIFGVTAAHELQRRGHQVRLVDPGPLPHPLAASTDISKVVRLEYGPDALYTEMAERSLKKWRGELSHLFHETGVAFLCRSPMTPDSFEGASYDLLRSRGHHPQRLDAAQIAARFPAWRGHIDGTFNPQGGFVESSCVVEHFLHAAVAQGAELVRGSLAALDESESRVRGALLDDGTRLPADLTICALGSWTPHALPFTAGWLRSTGMPVFHLRPQDPSLFSAEKFPVFGADLSNTGYYGFPLHQGVVKIANHGLGRALHPSSPQRAVLDGEIAALRAFLGDTFPSLTSAEIVYTRVCVYCDTWDGHFWIAPDPDRPDLLVATGGSGHAFKFAPILGELIADAALGHVHPRFRWRPEVHPPRSDEASRHQ
jgi:glycine/D-amino acid oxidase-like deaminating enzyme